MEGLALAVEPFDGEAARALAAALEDELLRIYAGVPGADPVTQPGVFAPPQGAFLIARLGGRPVGCGGVCRLDAQTAEVKRMYVAEDIRGRGLGRRLLDELEAQASGMGYLTIRLETGNLQPEAIGLYRAAGYERIPCWEAFADDPRSICFEKLLASPAA
ncbi:MAG: GNAT family N-acetyltransferase [Candidatus Limnocylindria bacterium]